ncbi:hypothetical protein HKCCE3408_10855 [Rhodobacterales bacterium HKCCE3408]|nr:hypothetical protein [Rhodobacterales bacterium HKCCE3408]
MADGFRTEDRPAFRRPPSDVMRLARMGSAHPTRLSFLRILLRRVRDEGWRVDRPVWSVDDSGVGRAAYRVRTPERTYCLVAFAHDLPPDQRTDRVIATAWDATFALVDGEPGEADLDRLQANVPLQEAGRIGPRELCLSRANRSVRLFEHVVDRLAEGQQPDPSQIAEVGYLMRTTAVYGSGKFGAADRAVIADRPELSAPFQAEMLTVWLIRQFTVDIVEHLAAARGGDRAVRMDRELRRQLGVGNSTGLGMAPFLVRHPMLLDHWMQVREEALARVRAAENASEETVAGARAALDAARENAARWRSEHPIQVRKLADLRADLDRIAERFEAQDWTERYPWATLWDWGHGLTLEGEEALLSILLEPHGALIDGLAHCLSADEGTGFRIDGTVSVAETRAALERRYDWALSMDFDAAAAREKFWYVSEEKLEPRLGERSRDAGAERELPLGIAGLAVAFHAALTGAEDEMPLAAFLMAHPEHRYMARRLQVAARYPYSEVQDNLTDAGMLPIDLLRCKLAFFGASRFDPRSDRWVRISLFQDAPYPLDPPEAG